jgi:hypothetical protein
MYNALADQLSESEVTHLPEVLHNQGTRIRISPVNILEILSIGEKPRKEKLVWVAQHIAGPAVLPEVETILIDYMARTVGDERVSHLIMQDDIAELPLLKEWESVWCDKGRTLGISPENIRSVDMLKRLSGFFHASATREAELADELERVGTLRDLDDQEELTARLERVTRSLHERTKRPTTELNWHEHVIFIIAQLLCVGVTLFPERIDAFWEALELHDTDAKLGYILEHPAMYMNGPLFALCDITFWQSHRKFNRGNFLDGYHIQYLQYVPKMLTRDAGLLEYCSACPTGSRIRTNVAHGDSFVRHLVEAVRGRFAPVGLSFE